MINKYHCSFVNVAYGGYTAEMDSAMPWIAAEDFVKKYDEEEPGEITQTCKVLVKGPDGKEETFTVTGEYSVEYNAYEDEDGGDEA